MQYQRLEQAAGDDQLLVLFVNQDTAEMVDPSAFLQALSDDAAARRREGWRLVSVSEFPLRQMGTAGNVFFQSGGQFATMVGLLAIYAAEPNSQIPAQVDRAQREADLKSDPPNRLTT